MPGNDATQNTGVSGLAQPIPQGPRRGPGVEAAFNHHHAPRV